MSYYLSESDKNRLQATIDTVDNLPVMPKGKKRPTLKNAFAYAKLTEQDENNLWSATEVYFDETGTPEDLEDGRVWGNNSPKIIVNGTVEPEQVIRVERYYLIDSEDKEQTVWVGSAVGGASDVRLLMNAATLQKGVASSNGASIIEYDGTVIESGVSIIQNLFDTAEIYGGEILYGFIDPNGNYALDKALLGT